MKKPYVYKGKRSTLQYGMSRIIPVELLVPMKCKTLYSNKKDAERDATAIWERAGYLTKIIAGEFPERGYELWVSVHKWGPL